MTFQNSVVGGVTLVRPAIQSPHYEEGTSGWTINQDGSAEFNDVTIRGGTVVSGLALYYDGTPAFGNLILSFAAAAGVDEYGNEYDQGITAHDTSGSKIIMEAGGGSSTISFVPRDIAGVTWQAGGIGQAISTRLGTNTPQMFAASPYASSSGSSSSSISFYGHPETSNSDATSEVIISGQRTSIFSPNVWLTGGPISMYDGNTFETYTPVVGGAGTATFSVREGWYQRIGKMIYFCAYVDLATAGSGAASVTITTPTDIDRTTRQTFTANIDNNAPNQGSYTGLVALGGSGNVVDRLRRYDGITLTGADLTASALLVVEGWYREA